MVSWTELNHYISAYGPTARVNGKRAGEEVAEGIAGCPTTHGFIKKTQALPDAGRAVAQNRCSPLNFRDNLCCLMGLSAILALIM